jgi:ATP-dependent Clp protease adaptor protein ClpS
MMNDRAVPVAPGRPEPSHRAAGILPLMGTVETARPPVRRRRPAGPGDGAGFGDAVRVIVLNDDHNTFEGVAAALARYIPGVDFARGMALANRIHNTGSAVVWSGDRERAELYWEQLKGAGLTMAPLG